MAASIENEIERYLLGDPVEASKAITAELNKSNSKFVTFIEKLESSLTSTNNGTRGRATHMIGDVLEMLPPSFLSPEQGGMVTTFLLTKLGDHHSVQPHALQSLAVLTSRCSSLGDDTARQICQTIFQEVQNQTLSHADRRATYRVLQNLLGTSTQALKAMGGDFVIGFIQQMDSEKDPRNLLICFNCAHFISSDFSLGPFTEEMFEVLGCYFPVDFVPPPNDPNGISKEELVLGLRKCFAATAKFAEYSVPLLLEKMTSDLQSARLDSFLTLIDCAPVYGQKGLTPFLGSITSTVRREVLMNISADLVEAARKAATAVYRAVAMETSQGNQNFSHLDENIVELYQDVVKYLEGADVKKSCQAYWLCRSVAESSPHALTVVLPLVLPSLLSRCQKQAEVSEQLAHVKELNGFLSVIHSQRTNKGVSASVQDSVQSLHGLFENLLGSLASDLVLEAVKGLTVISTIGLRDQQQTQSLLLERLVGKALTVHDSELRAQVMLSLRTILEKDPKLAEQTIGSLIQQSNKENFKMAADALVHAAVDTESFTRVNSFFLESISQDLPTSKENTEHLLSCARAVRQLLQRVSQTETFSHMQTATAMPLLSIAVKGAAQWTQECKETCEALMGCFRDAFSVLGQFMDKSEVTSLWDKLSLLFVEGDMQHLDLTEDVKKIQPLHSTSPWQQTQLVSLLEGFLTSADIQCMIERREQVFESSYVLALNSEDEFTHLSACRCVAVVMNKAPIGSQIQWFLEPIVEKLKQAMSPGSPLEGRLRALRLWMWLTKAMECRGHSATTILSSHLIALLSDPDLGPEVGRSLFMVVKDMEDVFSARLHSNVTPLYKQRFFSLNLKGIMNGYSEAVSKDVKQNYLLALSGIVSELPLQVTRPHLPVLMPLLLLALKDKENPNLSVLLSMLSAAVVNAPQAVTPSLDSLVPQLLDLAINFPIMKVRIASLLCLEQMTGLASHRLVPLQSHVVRQLQKSVGDRKRLVRKQAAETRSAWILLQPEKR